MSLLLLFKDYWHRTRGTSADIGWVPPLAPVPEEEPQKKRKVRKRRLIKVAPHIKVPFDRFRPSEWYVITWLLRARIQTLEQELAARIKQLQAELDAAAEIALQEEILARLDKIYERHDFALEQLARVREIMLHEEEEFMLFLMMQ